MAWGEGIGASLNTLAPYLTAFPLEFPLSLPKGARPGEGVSDPLCGWAFPALSRKMQGDMDPQVAINRPEGVVYLGDALEALKTLPSNSVSSCITSPPYWGLRDYGIPNQIGAEENLEEYIQKLVRVFREVRRVLKDDGSLWLNIGDTYTSGNRTWRALDKKNPARFMSYRPPTPTGLKAKDLIGQS